ncbi:MAG: oligosaccharide flippase family protein [Ginsengibacter sp.]
MSDDKNLVPSFYSGFVKLFSGLALVQLLNFGFALILPRFYTPDDYAFFGVFTAIVFILLEIITLKLDVTIFFPKEDDEAIEIVHAIFLVSFYFALITLLVSIWVSFFYNPAYLFLSFSIIVYGMVLPLSAWFNRKKDYRCLNTYRIIQAICIPVFSLFFVILFDWHFGLVMGFILGQLVGLVYLLISFKHLNYSLLKFTLVRKYIYRYQHFPKYGVLSSLVGSISRNSIVFFVKYFFGSSSAGHFTMSTKLLRAPAGAYQSALSQVFLQQASHMDNASAKVYIKKIVWFGFALGVLPVIAFLIFGQDIFGFLFGTEWLAAGKMAQYLVLWMFAMALVTPVGLMLDIKQKLKFELGWNIVLMVFRLCAILIAVLLNDLYLMMLLLSVVGVVMSIFLLVYVLKLTNGKEV